MPRLTSYRRLEPLTGVAPRRPSSGGESAARAKASAERGRLRSFAEALAPLGLPSSWKDSGPGSSPSSSARGTRWREALSGESPVAAPTASADSVGCHSTSAIESAW